MATKEAFFSNSNMYHISKKRNPVEILEFIKKHSPLSIWDLSKKIDLSRNSLYLVLRDLEFAGLIYSKLKTNESNRRVRIIYYNKKMKGELNPSNEGDASNSENKLGDENGTI